MADEKLILEVDFTEVYEQDDPDAVREVMVDAAAQLPRIVDDTSVRPVEGKVPGKLGISWLPILELVVSAPAVLLAIQELARIIRDKISTKSEITLRQKRSDGSVKEVSIKSNELSGAELEPMLQKFMARE